MAVQLVLTVTISFCEKVGSRFRQRCLTKLMKTFVGRCLSQKSLGNTPVVSVNIYLVIYFTQGTSRIFLKKKQTIYLLSTPRSIQPFLLLPTPVSISSSLC